TFPGVASDIGPMSPELAEFALVSASCASLSVRAADHCWHSGCLREYWSLAAGAPGGRQTGLQLRGCLV
ncbi:MAG TPA: hypothetical protein VD930_01295, partial [Gemmatimonadales bacterium]|nr:hypothetical protein [Gemmatimonadales bacterium]